MHILGVRIDSGTKIWAQKRLRDFLHEPGSKMVTTPNPEMLVLAHRDALFRDVLNQGSLNVPDGFGLRVAAFARGERIPERVTGVEVMEMLAELAHERGETMALLGGASDEGTMAAEKLRKKFPGVRVHAFSGGQVFQREDGSWQHHPEIFSWVQAVKPHILCVAFGHGAQERWIHRHLSHFPSVKVAVGVGGAFNYIAGKTARAPRWVQRMGLEWLWRLFHEPKRIGRITNAVIVFPLLVLRGR